MKQKRAEVKTTVMLGKSTYTVERKLTERDALEHLWNLAKDDDD